MHVARKTAIFAFNGFRITASPKIPHSLMIGWPTPRFRRNAGKAHRRQVQFGNEPLVTEAAHQTREWKIRTGQHEKKKAATSILAGRPRGLRARLDAPVTMQKQAF
jgi:hypothetical protein